MSFEDEYEHNLLPSVPSCFITFDAGMKGRSASFVLREEIGYSSFSTVKELFASSSLILTSTDGVVGSRSLVGDSW